MLQAVQPLPPILQKVVQQSSYLRFQATRTVEVRIKDHYVTHVEYVLRNGRQERIEFPADSAFKNQVIVDNGTERKRYLPRKNQVTVQPSFQDEALNGLVDRNGRMRKRRVELANGGAIVGINTIRADIETAKGQVRQQLWIDPSSGAVLKRVGYDAQGQEVAGFQYTAINYNPRLNSQQFELNPKGAIIITPMDDLVRIAHRLGLPDYALDGNSRFKLISARRIDKGNIPILSTLYQGPHGERVSVFELIQSVDENKLRATAGKGSNVKVIQIGVVNLAIIGPMTASGLNQLALHLHKL